MPRESDEDSSIKPKEFVFLLAIAGRLDAQSRLLAQKLDDERYIYHAYSVLDALSSSYSMFKYFFEVFISNSNDSKLMHDIMTSPGGIAAITGEALFLVAFSFLASYFDGDKDTKNNAFKKFIVTAWPYFRDGIKALKNSYKGWKSAVQIINVLGGVDLRYLLIPVGLTLGIVAMANRFWLRHMVEKRKDMMEANKNILLEIQGKDVITATERDSFLNRIQAQSEQERIQAFFSVGLGGLIDGLYLYAGVIGLALLPTPAFVAMATISLFYALACIVSRVYEEYDFQLRLHVTRTKCKLALAGKELETAYKNLLLVQNEDEPDLDEVERLKKEVARLIEEVEKQRNLLTKQTTHTYFTAALLGMKYGLFAYGVAASFLFMVTSIFALTSAVFPPALLITFVVSGLALMIGITAYTTRTHYNYLEKQKKKEAEPFSKLVELKDRIKQEQIEAQPIKDIFPPEKFNDSLKNGMSPKGTKQFFLQEWLEVLRSFFSGLSKGNNFSTFVSTPLQDGEPHDQEVPVMTLLTMINAALFSIILALRALARGFGRTPVGQTSAAPKAVCQDSDSTTTQGKGESRMPPDSLPKPRSFINIMQAFFAHPKPKRGSSSPSTPSASRPRSPTLIPIPSAVSLPETVEANDLATHYTALGLN